ncbi:MAG: sodium-translocating pyrophosphatase [Phycisphaerales bacterium]|nr:sodium-translocating pyrophosphatase [Phycisphaerales bacterium]
MNELTLASFNYVAENIPAWFIAPGAAILGLLAAFYFSRKVMAQSEGEPLMVEIATAVRSGAMAYLKRQYIVVFCVFVALLVVLAVLAGFGIQPIWTVIGVAIAGTLSGLCGWFGMKMATNASARTTFAAKQSLNDGLTVAFRAGAVMGLVVVGFALLDASVWYFVWNMVPLGEGETTGTHVLYFTAVMLSYGMGASTQALFARVGGGIYTKAADVGADLVGKVEAGIPEDDPRNPATIADNVGDNVGDVAGMGADLYESYYGSILAAMALGAAAAMGLTQMGAEVTDVALRLTVLPMALAGLGILCSLIGIYFVKAKEGASFKQLLNGLHMGVYVASGLLLIGSLGLLYWILSGLGDVSWLGLWGAILCGLLSGLVIARATEYYTSYEHKPTQEIAEQAETGAATVIISGIAVGMRSTWIPLMTIVVAIIAAFTMAGGREHFLIGLYGVAIAAVGMLSTLGITLATDAYGPIADNAGGNAEMSDQPEYVRERTDMLDSLGNTTAATGKGFAIGSAALTAMALLAAYVAVVQGTLIKKLTADSDAIQAIYAEADPPGNLSPMAYGEFDLTGEHRIHAQYEGHGQFKALDISESGYMQFGGLMVAAPVVDRMIDDNIEPGTIVELDGHWADTANVYQIDAVVIDGEKEPASFQLVAAHRATISQILNFYDISIMNPRVLGGIFLGVMLAFVFCAMTMSAVGRAAYQMMGECRRQFAKMKAQFKKDGMSDADLADPMKWPRKVMVDGVQYPDYAECVSISTAGAQKEMVVPAIMAIVTPVLVGIVLGVGGVMGLLVGGLTSGFAIAIFMANAGGAWDNAKKYIEAGHHGGKGSDAHKAGVVGDTVGDPFKDTSGPALNILIKLIAIVSVVFAGLVVYVGPGVSAWFGLD